MVRDVQNIFYDIVVEFGVMEYVQVVDYVKKLMIKGCYFLDVWSQGFVCFVYFVDFCL